MKKISILLLCSILTFSCQTNRTIMPTITGSSRQYINLKQPITVAIMDSRNNTGHAKVVESLQSGLKKIYGNNIVFKPYFDKTGNSNVAIKINVKQIEANFGTRLIHYRTYHNQVLAVSSSVSTYWGTAVSSAIVSQPVFTDNFIPAGYWIGTSYLEIALVDNLHKEKNIYTFPFVAEDKQSNTWGYSSANKAAQNSWKQASSHLLDLIDSIALYIMEFED